MAANGPYNQNQPVPLQLPADADKELFALIRSTPSYFAKQKMIENLTAEQKKRYATFCEAKETMVEVFSLSARPGFN